MSIQMAADDMLADARHGGSFVYGNAPAGHVWELLKVGDARRPPP